MTLLKNNGLLVDAIVTDPPYQMVTERSGFALIRREHFDGLASIGSSASFSVLPYLPFFQKVCNPLVLFLFTNKNEMKSLIEWAESNKFSWDLLTWHKKNPMPMFNRHLLRDTEFIFYARAPGAFFPDSRSDYDLFRTWFVEDSPLRKIGRNELWHPALVHPCRKPLSILENLVQLACPEGHTILDPFVGSGTTLQASLLHERNGIGFEIDPRWEPLLIEAIKTHSSKLASFNDEKVMA